MKLNLKQTFANAHKTLTVWFAYLVAASITLQEFGGTLNDQLPPRIRHWVVGGAALFVVIDKFRRSKVVTDAPPSA